MQRLGGQRRSEDEVLDVLVDRAPEPSLDQEIARTGHAVNVALELSRRGAERFVAGCFCRFGWFEDVAVR